MTREVHGEPGDNIYSAARKVEHAAIYFNTTYVLIFNGIRINVYPGSVPNDIAEKYMLKMELQRLGKN